MRRAPAPASIRPITYRNPRHPELPIEVLALGELRRKAPAEVLARPSRPAFHHLHVVTRGRCELEVDFERVALDRSTVAWVRPGQVQRFDLHAGVEGWLVMFTAEILEAELFAEPIGPGVALGAAAEDVGWLVDRLRRVSEEAEPAPDQRPLLRHLLHALALVVRRCGRAATRAPSSSVFALFRDEVERRFAATRRVEDYERYIGYSAKTLTRAARAATGLSAKQYVAQRVVLESRRLLAHSALGAGEIARRVGFSELTNFIKFFRRETGEAPAEFRRRGAVVSPGPRSTRGPRGGRPRRGR